MKKSIKDLQQQLVKDSMLSMDQQNLLRGGSIIIADVDML